MQVYRVVYKTYPNGNRVDEEVVFMSNGRREPFSSRMNSRSHYEFTTPEGERRFHPDDMVVFDTLAEFMGDPPEDVVREYPEVEWEEWFEETAEGKRIEELI